MAIDSLAYGAKYAEPDYSAEPLVTKLRDVEDARSCLYINNALMPLIKFRVLRAVGRPSAGTFCASTLADAKRVWQRICI